MVPAGVINTWLNHNGNHFLPLVFLLFSSLVSAAILRFRLEKARKGGGCGEPDTRLIVRFVVVSIGRLVSNTLVMIFFHYSFFGRFVCWHVFATNSVCFEPIFVFATNSKSFELTMRVVQ